MKQIATGLQKQIADDKSPSVQYAWFDKDVVRLRYSFGVANVKQQVVANAQTTYHGFSTTKTFTALAVMQFCDQ